MSDLVGGGGATLVHECIDARRQLDDEPARHQLGILPRLRIVAFRATCDELFDVSQILAARTRQPRCFGCRRHHATELLRRRPRHVPVTQRLFEPAELAELLRDAQPLHRGARRVSEDVLEIFEDGRESELSPDALLLRFAEPSRFLDIQSRASLRDRSQLPIDLAIAHTRCFLRPRGREVDTFVPQHASTVSTRFFDATVCALRDDLHFLVENRDVVVFARAYVKSSRLVIDRDDTRRTRATSLAHRVNS